MKVSCYAAMTEKQPLEPYQYETSELGDHEIAVSISHCGICYSDVHMIDNDIGISTFPFVPGHEIAGQVSDLGSKVDRLKPGDRVGIGWQARSCMHCEWCLRGEENKCPEIVQSATWTPYGGFASSIVVDSRFAFPFPRSLASENAASLMCGGITVYSPLRKWARPEMKVGVIGIGGLGHLALQFARAYGCEVTAFSSSAAKEEDAFSFGAQHFINCSKSNGLQKLTRTFDMLLFTSHFSLDWDDYLSTLKPDGKLCVLGIPPEPIHFHAAPFIFGRQSVNSSAIGGSVALREMLAFAGRHNIKAQVEIMPMAQVNAAIQKLKQKKARYRMVLAN